MYRNRPAPKTATSIFNENGEGRRFAAIRDQQLDWRKQAAIYQEDWLIAVADDFAEAHVDAIFEIADSARDALTDSFIRHVGRAFYQTRL